MKLVVIYILLINLIALALFGVDKKRAQNHQWRISEATLLTSAWAGGAIGAFAGMQLFRHKTQHSRFQITVPLLVIVDIALILIFL
ncbi:MAG: DUF1294 domain-containing protein [Bacteroidales bacterium]|nr:DUF1294 domain-containing protein [Bacteroidales bacterium]